MKKVDFFILILVTFLFVSCSSQKTVTPPKLFLPKTFPHFKSNLKEKLCERWWRELKDPLLNQLISQALKNNYDIKLAAERILQMEAISQQQRALKFPTLGLNFSGEFTYLKSLQSSPYFSFLGSSTSMFPGSSFSDRIQKYYNMGLAAAYEPDLWGRIHSVHKASERRVISARWGKKLVEISIAAEVSNKYLELRFLKTRLNIVQREKEILKKEISFLKKRYQAGEIPISQLKQKKILYLKICALETQLKKDYEITKQALAVLLGSFREIKDYIKKGLPKVPNRLPAGIPADLLKRRPDIKMVEAELQAAHEEYLSALAERFPQISLTGTLGTASSALKDLFSADSFLWKLALGTGINIFDAGRIKARAQAAKAVEKEIAVKYARTVLNAFWEVERALVTEEKLRKILEIQKKIYQESIDLKNITEKRYVAGISNFIALLEAKFNCLQAEENLLQTQFLLLTNRIFLYRALGGGTKKCQIN